jgi:hypothetical protein
MRHPKVANPRGRLGTLSRRTTATAVVSGIKSAAAGLCGHVTQSAGDKDPLETAPAFKSLSLSLVAKRLRKTPRLKPRMCVLEESLPFFIYYNF